MREAPLNQSAFAINESSDPGMFRGIGEVLSLYAELAIYAPVAQLAALSGSKRKKSCFMRVSGALAWMERD